MTSINVGNTIVFSSLSGLANDNNITLSYQDTSHVLAGNAGFLTTITITPDNPVEPYFLTSIMVNLEGLETIWRPVTGLMQKTFKDGSNPDFDVIVSSHYSGESLVLNLMVFDDTGLTNTIPAIKYNFRINTYVPPFAT